MDKLLQERKNIAKMFIESEQDDQHKQTIIDLFSMYNQQIINILGISVL